MVYLGVSFGAQRAFLILCRAQEIATQAPNNVNDALACKRGPLVAKQQTPQ